MVFGVLFKQKTAYEMRISDWSSDLCSSDLVALSSVVMLGHRAEHPGRPFRHLPWALGSRPRVTVEGGGAMCAITAGWRASPTLDRYGAENRCARLRQ